MVSGALNSNSPLEILTHFLFDIDKNELSITASDLETTITTHLAVESKEKGKIAVNARLLTDMLKTFGDEPLSFTINQKTFGIEVSTGQG
jgi:DNA polymerase-3 subunit beta